MARKINLSAIKAMDPETKVSRERAGELLGVKASTIANYNYAGILPYAPTRPITVRAGDLQVCAQMLVNGVRQELHLGLRIKQADMPTYSRLAGVTQLDYGHPSTMIRNVVKLTGHIWSRYKKEPK